MEYKLFGEFIKDYTPEGYLKSFLPYGLNRKGKVVRNLALDEPDGTVEERASDKKIIDDNPIRVFDIYLTLCLKEMEGFKKDSEVKNDKDPDAFTLEHVERLSTLDREFIFLLITFLVFGKDYKLEMKCPECGQELVYEEDLSKIKIPYIPDEERAIKGKFKRPYIFRGKEITTYEALFPNGILQSVYFNEKARENAGIFKSHALYSVINRLGEESNITLDEIKSLKKGMRDSIFENVMDVDKYSLNLERVVVCDSCKHESKFVLNNTFF